MPELRKLTIEDEDVYYSLSFDINDFIGDGVWWLQVYDSNKKLIYDNPFASSKESLDASRIAGMITREVYEG